MSQADMCRAAGFSSSQWAQYETGERRLSLNAALKLHSIFGVTLDFLYLGDMSGLPVRLAAKILENADAERKKALLPAVKQEKIAH
jgi:transcriptional regulator with XRE-family HTH domain